MQELLDFVHDHSLEAHFYCVLPTATWNLELYWARNEPSVWEVRELDTVGVAVRIPRGELLDFLELRGAEPSDFEAELRAHVAAQIGAANAMLNEADRVLGPDSVEAILEGQRRFATELSSMVSSLLAPRLEVVSGEGRQSRARVGHLALVR